MSVLPNNPFDEVSVDFALVNGETLILLVDDYSRFPFVEPVSSTSASAVIPKLDKLQIMDHHSMVMNLSNFLKCLVLNIAKLNHFGLEPMARLKGLSRP
jgi:hypothetical protein